MEPSTSTVSLLENHEHEYAIISADITSKIGKLSNHSGGKSGSTYFDLEKYSQNCAL